MNCAKIKKYIWFKFLNSSFFNKPLVRSYNFWSGFKQPDLWFNPMFDQYFDILRERKIKVNFYSCFGPRQYITWDKKQNVKIFYTGENVYQFPWLKYSDHCLDFADLSIGFARNIRADNYIHLPLWILYYFKPTDSLDNIKQKLMLLEEKKFREEDLGLKQFCCLVASHDSNGMRKWGLEELSKIDIVKSGGRFMNNTDELKNEFNNNKQEFLMNFKFNMAFENSNQSFYTTEKIFDAIFAACIPIYYGSENLAEPEVLNQNRIIYFREEGSLDLIRELNTNNGKLISFYTQRIFNDFAAEYIFDLINQTRKKIREAILNK
jgi:hypothetical protein